MIGDREAEFASFWESEREPLYRALALLTGDHRLAGEAVDEAMTRAWARWERIREYERPAGWVYRVARNWATSWFRKARRRVGTDPAELDRAVTDVVPDVDVQGLLEGLAQRDRELLVLRYFLEFTPTEIARWQDVPVGTVKSRLHRALAGLRGEVEEETA